MIRITLAAALAALFCGCVTNGDPTPAIEADLMREEIVREQRELTVAIVDAVENWSADQKATIRERADRYVEQYAELAEKERVYLGATAGADWRDLAREALRTTGDLIREGGDDDR